MHAYADTLTSQYGIENPTVGDMLTIVFNRVGKKPDILIYTDEQKRQIGTENAKIAGKFADEIIITEEDDRDVDGNEILAKQLGSKYGTL